MQMYIFQCIHPWMYIFLLVCVCTNMPVYKDMWAGVCSPFCHGIVKYAINFAEQRCPNNTPGAPSQTCSDRRPSLHNAQPLRGFPALRGFRAAEVSTNRRFSDGGCFRQSEVFAALRLFYSGNSQSETKMENNPLTNMM